jgi:pyruvate dehydrogenase E2 component (dihydrolipoamide acetyltransferase)
MAVEFFVHKMSEHMATAQILKWHVGEGDRVEKFQVLVEVMTDKVAAEIESPAAGVIRGMRLGAVEGATVPVGEVLCFIAEPGDVVAPLPPLGLVPAGAPCAPTAPAEGSGRTAGSGEGSAEDRSSPGGRATPAARRLARELGIDIAGVSGSGPHGSVTEVDVRAYAARRAHTGRCP